MGKGKYTYAYRQILLDEGISESRVDDLCWALYELHKAIIKLDCRNLDIFLTPELEERVNDYAIEEDLIDISALKYNCGIK